MKIRNKNFNDNLLDKNLILLTDIVNKNVLTNFLLK